MQRSIEACWEALASSPQFVQQITSFEEFRRAVRAELLTDEQPPD